jgi:AcrR family transcriptional regulator
MPRSSGKKAKHPERPAAQKKRTLRAGLKAKDEARTLALLWTPQERAARSSLNTPVIVGAAVKLADTEGFEAVSMRRLADQLGVGTMSLYTHVPGKLELTDLMIDAVHADLYESLEEAQRQPGGYREGIRFVAERNKALYLRHPWLLDVPLGRPVLGPHMVQKYETELRVLDGIGLTAVQIDSIEALLVMQVQAAARLAVVHARAEQLDGMTEMEWWMNIMPLLQRVKRGQFPVAARIGKAAGEALAPGPSAEHLFQFGLEVLCEAVAAMIARNQRIDSSG